MFHLDLGDELGMARDTAQRFATEILNPRQRDFEHDRGVPESIRRQFAGLGLSTVDLPESLGGAGLGALGKAVILEELGAGDPGASLALDPLGPAGAALLELGGERAVETLALPLLDRDGARAMLVWDDGRYLHADGDALSGRIPWIPADRLDLLIVLTPDSGFALGNEGLRLSELHGSGLRAAGASELILDNAPVLAHWPDPAAVARALARARLHVSALLVGVLRAAAEYSREYAMGRIAFGKPIAHHQALAFLIADMRTAVDGARLLVQDAAWRADNALPFEEAAAGAFVETVEASMFVAPNALQILGGAGFMQDYPVEKYMREARTLGLLLGGIDRAREDSASGLDDGPLPVRLTLSDLDRAPEEVV